MKQTRHPGRPALMSSLLLLVGLTSNTALAQTRVDRNLSIQSAGTPVFNNDLPATATTLVPAVTPPMANQASRNSPSGSYSSEAMGATILAKNADYETTFRINLPVPPGSRISNVSWRYGLSSKPVGFEAVLCWNNQQRCWNVTNNASGNTVAFNGKDATRPLTLHYRVKGGGQLGPPAQGEMNQVIVTYDLPG